MIVIIVLTDSAVFVCMLQLLHSVTSWHGVISQRQLMELACDSLIKRYLVVALQNCIFGSEFLSLFRAVSTEVLSSVKHQLTLSCNNNNTIIIVYRHL